MSSTIEQWQQLDNAERELRESGLEASLEQRVKNRIQMVLDSASGTRTPRNLWGLLPIGKQELFRWNDGADIFPDTTKVAGKRIPYTELGELGEILVDKVLNSLGVDSLTSVHEEAHINRSIREKDVYSLPGSPIEFHRIEWRTDGGGVPGFPSTYQIVLQVVRSEPPKK